MTIMFAGDVKSRFGTGIFLQMYSHTTSMLYLSCAEMGMTGAPSAMVPWMNFTDGVVLVRRRVLLHQVDLVLKDDDVLQPHDLHRGEVLRGLRLRARLVPRDEQSAPSITAAPLSMVAMRISCPGQSTKDTCRTSFIFLSSKPGTSQSARPGIVLPYAR